MIIYRPHRGSLAEAMEEVREFKSEKEMKEYIIKDWDNSFSIDDIVIDTKIVNDDRVGWKDSKLVCIKRFKKEDYITLYGSPQCIGTCATDYK